MKQLCFSVALLLIAVALTASPIVASENTSQKQNIPAASKTNTAEAGSLTDDSKKAATAQKTIVATVDGSPVNMYDLTGMMNRMVRLHYANVKDPSPELLQEIKLRAFNRLVFEELAVNEAERQGLEVKATDVQEVIDNLKMGYKTEKGYQDYLKGLGITKSQMRERIIQRRMFEGITGREVYQKVTVDQEEVKKVYLELKEAGKLKKVDEFFVKEILLMASKEKSETIANAERLLTLLKKLDYDFGKLVLDGTFIVRTIQIRKEKYPEIYNRMLKMEVGQFSPVVEENGTFHIFKVLEKNLARDMTEEEARKYIEDQMAPYFQEKRRAEWAKELRKDAKIVIMDKDLKGK